MAKKKSKVPHGTGESIHDNAAVEKRNMDDGDWMWSQKGATLSDKSARQEFGLTQQEIIAAIRVGKLQFRESNMHGKPWYRLLRHKIESLVRDKSGQSNSQDAGILVCDASIAVCSDQSGLHMA